MAMPALGDDARYWSEADVAEWLRSVGCAHYARLFLDNHIDGDALLEVDQAVVKELGVSKVGDRVRLVVAIRGLRARTASGAAASAGHARASKAQTLDRFDDAAAVSPFAASPSPSALSPVATTPVFPSSVAAVAGPTAPQYVQTSATTATLAQANVRFIFTRGHTKVVDISGCLSAEAIVKRGIRKFGCRDQPTEWTAFIATDAGAVREVGTNELVALCHTSRHPARERIMLVPMSQSPTKDQYQRSIQISWQQAGNEAAAHATTPASSTRPATYIDNTVHDQLSPVPPLPPPGPKPALRSPTSPRDLPPAPPIALEQQENNHKQEQQQQEPAVEDSEILDSTLRPKRIRKFLGQRPPSELISSNLAEYFPGHESRVLEQTVRNSIRRSKRISKRISVATTASYTSSLHDSFMAPNQAGSDDWRTQQQSDLPPLPPRPQSQQSAYTTFSQSSTRPQSSITQWSMRRQSQASIDSSSMRRPSVGEAEDDQFDAKSIDQQRRRPFSLFSRPDTINSAMSDNNSIIELEEPDNEDDLVDDETAIETREDGEEDEARLEADYDADGGPTRWIRGAFIGSGSFGSVVLGLNALTGELMAVKQVEMTKDDQGRKKSMLDALHREIQLLRDMQHENIVQYIGSSSDGQFLNIFLEYVPGGSVATLLSNYGPLEEPLIRIFVKQILCGLTYLHDRDIIHRDIKGANVLVDNKGKIKISDFGISKRVEAGLMPSGANGKDNLQHHRPSLQGSVYWMAPEVVKQTSYTRKADIWSLGCLVVEMFTGTHPFPNSTQMQALFKIGTMCSPDIPKVASEDARQFLDCTFELDFEKRASAAELLHNPFLEPAVTTTTAGGSGGGSGGSGGADEA
ncbi:kinase-like domain-containing protein [Limtongia smithiae]|uniref:kinase-like domain-containing protein n=1 Tax=Limtongia smithiae TaxID=1125753 RepID=UPI0034CE9D80